MASASEKQDIRKFHTSHRPRLFPYLFKALPRVRRAVVQVRGDAVSRCVCTITFFSACLQGRGVHAPPLCDASVTSGGPPAAVWQTAGSHDPTSTTLESNLPSRSTLSETATGCAEVAAAAMTFEMYLLLDSWAALRPSGHVFEDLLGERSNVGYQCDAGCNHKALVSLSRFIETITWMNVPAENPRSLSGEQRGMVNTAG